QRWYAGITISRMLLRRGDRGHAKYGDPTHKLEKVTKKAISYQLSIREGKRIVGHSNANAGQRGLMTDRPIADSRLTHSARLWRSVGPVIPVLRRRDIGHAPLVTVPPVKAVHLQRPESSSEIADHDQTVAVSHVNPEGTVVDPPGEVAVRPVGPGR